MPDKVPVVSENRGLSPVAILSARCPNCRRGKILRGVFAIRPRCEECGYNFYPEPGFYLGAMMIGYFVTAALTVPPLIILKFLKVDLAVLVVFPFLEFIFVGTFVLFYCRILWLHVEHRMTSRLDRG